ncbi:hypothetical protein F2Q69_00052789 [Brassica cretica]|uniref:Uncharacterized protein n=1 Tax=Brassica cretica TaxID=69181 RepID=A0A8S9N5R3_BRACR|nr:hypothetical protein F2Q69_00052789 [Brassica cretica]
MVHFRFISQVKYWNPSAGLEFFSIFIFDGKQRKMFLLIGLPLSVKKFVPENCASSGETPDLNDTQFTKLDELLTQTQLYSKNVRPKNPSPRRKEVVDAKERRSQQLSLQL